MENKYSVEINKAKSWFFGKTNKMQTSVRLSKEYIQSDLKH